MQLIYLSRKNVSDDIFLKDFSHNFRFLTPALVLYDSPFQSLTETCFIGKRISSFLSDQMIVNISVSGHQRNLLSLEGQVLSLRLDLIQNWWKTVPVVIMNTVSANEKIENGSDIIRMLIQLLNPDHTVIFTDNPLSPLGASDEVYVDSSRLSGLMDIYPEEKTVLTLAQGLLPVSIRTPKVYSRDIKN